MEWNAVQLKMCRWNEEMMEAGDQTEQHINRHGQHNILQTWRWKVGQQNSHPWERGRADEG